MSHHLPGLPDGAAQEHAEDHPEHLEKEVRWATLFYVV